MGHEEVRGDTENPANITTQQFQQMEEEKKTHSLIEFNLTGLSYNFHRKKIDYHSNTVNSDTPALLESLRGSSIILIMHRGLVLVCF